ncbi:hypothetical protein KI387_038230, partial [Taxus chinensis]
TFLRTSSAQNVSTQNFGFTSGSGTTSQIVGVQYSTITEAHGSTSIGPIPIIGGGSGGIGGSSFGGSGGFGGRGNTR